MNFDWLIVFACILLPLQGACVLKMLRERRPVATVGCFIALGLTAWALTLRVFQHLN